MSAAPPPIMEKMIEKIVQETFAEKSKQQNSCAGELPLESHLTGVTHVDVFNSPFTSEHRVQELKAD